MKAAKRAEVRLPELAAWQGGGLEPDGDYDAVEFVDVDFGLAGGDRGPVHGLCAATVRAGRGGAGEGADPGFGAGGGAGVGTDLSGASLRDVELVEARLGGVQLHGAVLERVVVRGGKIDYLNLRKAKLKDVVFEGCVLVEPDFAGAVLERVEFRDCTLRGADFQGARMSDVDLREAVELGIARGVDALAGAVISPAQLYDLAPALAAQLGVRVVP